MKKKILIIDDDGMITVQDDHTCIPIGKTYKSGINELLKCVWPATKQAFVETRPAPKQITFKKR